MTSTTYDAARTVLVTGAAGGLGSATVRLLAERGWHVFAADVAPGALASVADHPRVSAVEMDVTDAASVAAAAEAVTAAAPGLDGIVNFAGVLVVGSLVEIDEDALRHILDVNVLGTYRVNRTFFDLVLRRRGRIVTISSETGHQTAAPFNGPYAMSKHAIEAYSDALRRELMLLGVRVIKIQPGPFRTAMVADIERVFSRAAATSTHFGDVLTRMLRRVADEQRKAHDPALLAEVVVTALSTPSPKPAYRVRTDPQRALLDLLPTRAADAVLRRVLSR